MTPEQREVLLRRTRALAKSVREESPIPPEATLEVMRIQVDGVPFYLSSEAILSVVRAPRITPLPRATAPVAGLVAWRGRPLTLLSLRASQPSGDVTSMIVVLGAARRAVAALLVDDADDVSVIDRRTLAEAPAGTLSRYAIGVSTDAILVLDGARILGAIRSSPQATSSP